MQPFRIEHFDTVVSTNELVKHGLEMGYDEGLVCRAAEQVGGYGRQGRTWVSPRGGLYQSILLRPDVPDSQVATLSLVVGLAVREALLALSGLDHDAIQVKWPNDVVCESGKLAGISLEAHAGGVCVGVGVNVFHSADEASIEGKNVPAYLADLLGKQATTLTVDAVGDEVLVALESRYDIWCNGGFAPFVDEFNECNALAGKRVDIADRNGNVVKSGPVAGVNANGSLLVGNAPISSGEAHIL